MRKKLFCAKKVTTLPALTVFSKVAAKLKKKRKYTTTIETNISNLLDPSHFKSHYLKEYPTLYMYKCFFAIKKRFVFSNLMDEFWQVDGGGGGRRGGPDLRPYRRIQ
jgi:hypothetical protein